MDRYLVLDTETCNCPKINGQLDVKNAQFYDIGLQTIDEDGTIYTKHSIVNEDVFFNMPAAMKEAYFASKITQYIEEIHSGKREIMNTLSIYQLVRRLCRTYNIKACIAHNARFDLTALNATLRYQTKSKYRWFLPYDMPIIDTMKLAHHTICQQDEYKKFCKVNGYMTNHAIPQVRKTAEVLWRFFTNNTEFVEEHTGLEDVMIEAQIFVRCKHMQEGALRPLCPPACQTSVI